MTEAEREIQKAREMVETASQHLTKLIECCRYQGERARLWKGAATFILLSLVCALSLLALSGCLTAGKIRTWESALLGWARKGNQDCVDAVKVASTYLVNANHRLQGATGATDVQPDGDAKKLMTEAAVKCGKRVP